MKLTLTAPFTGVVLDGLPQIVVSPLVPMIARGEEEALLKADLGDGSHVEITSKTVSTSRTGWPVMLIEAKVMRAGVPQEDRLGVLYDTLQWSAMATLRCAPQSLAHHRVAALETLLSGQLDADRDIVGIDDLFSLYNQ